MQYHCNKLYLCNVVICRLPKNSVTFAYSKIMKIFTLLLVLCLGLTFAMAQTPKTKLPMPKLGPNDTIRVGMTELDGEVVPWILGGETVVRSSRTFASQVDRENYLRLRYNVLRVEPYAIFARNRYKQLERDLATTADKKKQKEMVKACEKEIKDLFNREIKNMTITQGELLIKLVNRETGNTSFEMVKELKGGINAFMFQSIARIFGHNLKETYDPAQERDIEAILNSAGYTYHYN